VFKLVRYQRSENDDRKVNHYKVKKKPAITSAKITSDKDSQVLFYRILICFCFFQHICECWHY